MNVKHTVKVRVSEKVTLENLHTLLDRIVGISGCRACGLLGVDLHLTGDPVEWQEIKKLTGFQSVNLGE
jgi:hypothetical protein